MRRSPLVAAVLAVAACTRPCKSAATPATPVPAGDATVVKILLGGRLCAPGAPVDPDLSRDVRLETPALVAAFVRQGLVVPDPVDDPSKDDVACATAPIGAHPLIVVYSGHGRLAELDGTVLSEDQHLAPPHRPLRSVFCLRDGPMPIENAARGFRGPTPAALLIANACFSARVDLRGVGAEVSVLSGSTSAITAAGTTPIARKLTDVLTRPLDCDGDRLASDFEIFSPLQRAILVGGGNPNPKLLRQLHRVPAFFRTTQAECPLPPPPLDGPSTEFFPGGRKHLRFPGRVPDDPIGTSGSAGFADPCSEPVGQCFDVSPRPPS